MLTEAYLGLGSNLGDRRSNITWAVDRISDMSSSLTCSSLYESRPQGFDDQPWFMNAVCHLWTTMDPFSLLAALRAVQESVGGRRAFTNGPRVLDIDILLYGSSVIDTPVLAVPHPRMWERGFVLAPSSGAFAPPAPPGNRRAHPLAAEQAFSHVTGGKVGPSSHPAGAGLAVCHP